MKTKWDYSELAEAYLKRPDYSDAAIDMMMEVAGVAAGSNFCDVGAGVGHLTIKLRERGMRIAAVEPNDNMRALGMERTAGMSDITWSEGVGEATGQPDATFDMVTFGSSFNVTDRLLALQETKRILKIGGWFAAMWNHRDLNDPIQAEIESIIKSAIPGYQYGARREDQTEIIAASGLFKPARQLEAPVEHSILVDDVIEAWRSHGTLQKQAGDGFTDIIDQIAAMLHARNEEKINVPYTTRIWLAQLV